MGDVSNPPPGVGAFGRGGAFGGPAGGGAFAAGGGAFGGAGAGFGGPAVGLAAPFAGAQATNVKNVGRGKTAEASTANADEDAKTPNADEVDKEAATKDDIQTSSACAVLPFARLTRH